MLFLIFPFLRDARRVHELVPGRAAHAHGRGARPRRARRRHAGRSHAAAGRHTGPRHPREPRAGAVDRARARWLQACRGRGRSSPDSAPAPSGSPSSGSACSPRSSCARRAARTRSRSGSCSVAFLIAGLGNALGTPSADLQRIESSWLTWLSPFGWGENSRPFADDNVWPLLLCVGFGLALAGVSIAIQTSRDLGASLVPERRGHADARLTLAGPTHTRLAPHARFDHRMVRSAGCSPGCWRRASLGVLADVASELPAVQAMLGGDHREQQHRSRVRS